LLIHHHHYHCRYTVATLPVGLKCMLVSPPLSSLSF
jgi:hypothetical protein